MENKFCDTGAFLFQLKSLDGAVYLDIIEKKDGNANRMLIYNSYVQELLEFLHKNTDIIERCEI